MKDSSPIRMNITTLNDIEKLKTNPNIKYINLNIEDPNIEVLYYFIDNGEKYSYAERSTNNNGYIYVSHEIFKQSQLFIFDIINNIPPELNELEIARYLYITIAKNIGLDINIIPEKNETINLENINIIHNLWGSIYNNKGTNKSLTNIFLFLCKLMGINCKIIKGQNSEELRNILEINKRKIITDITNDIPYIQAGFKTKNFIGYNDNLNLDKKIAYIKDEYSNEKIEQLFNQIDYTKEETFYQILTETSKIIKAENIKPIELGIIYKIIFDKYCPTYEISINNLYIKNTYHIKNHFILIQYNNKYYSYNYTKNNFTEIPKKEILKNLETKKIGIYLNEKIPSLTSNQTEILL